MRLVVLYGPSLPNDFVVGSLVARWPALVVREHQSTLDVLRRTWRRPRDPVGARLDKLAFFAFYVLRLRRRVDADLIRVLGPYPPVPAGPAVARADDALPLVRAHRPDVVLALGTSILSAAWDTLGVPVANVHIGIAPRYRGRFCWFWPLVEGHPEDVGVTVHLVTARVDAGPVLLQRRVPAAALRSASLGETLAVVTILARDLAAELLADPASHVAAATPPSPARAPAYLEPGLSTYLRWARHRGDAGAAVTSPRGSDA